MSIDIFVLARGSEYIVHSLILSTIAIVTIIYSIWLGGFRRDVLGSRR